MVLLISVNKYTIQNKKNAKNYVKAKAHINQFQADAPFHTP